MNSIETKKADLLSFLDKELARLDRAGKKNSKELDSYIEGNFDAKYDLLAGRNADALGRIIAKNTNYANVELVFKEFYSLINKDSSLEEIESKARALITVYEEKLQRYTIAFNILDDIDAVKRTTAEMLPKIHNNVDVISQRDWFAIANIKSNICYLGDMIDILKDFIKIIK